MTDTVARWRITLQAHGPVENLKVTLSSDPALSQEDIVLLLTIGMTRAELDDVVLHPPIQRFLRRWESGDPAVYLGSLWAP